MYVINDMQVIYCIFFPAYHNILTYIEDATAQLLRYRADIQAKIDVNKFFAS